MKQFNLTEYLNLKRKGEKPRIITRAGLNVRIICTDKHHESGCIVALINDNGTEYVQSYHENGSLYRMMEDKLDLFFADLDPEPTYRPYKDAEECFKEVLKHGGWVKNAKGQYMFIGGVADTTIISFNDCNRQFEIAPKVWRWADDGSPLAIKNG